MTKATSEGLIGSLRRIDDVPTRQTREGWQLAISAKRQMDFRWHCVSNHYDNSTLNSSGLVDRCVLVFLLGLVLGGEQAAPRYRDGSGHGKSRVTAESSCRDQRGNRPLCQLVSRQVPVSKGSV